MKDIVDLSKSSDLFYPWSEIYGWLANSWDYGPYWSLLKENIKNLWIKTFIQKRDDTMLLRLCFNNESKSLGSKLTCWMI